MNVSSGKVYMVVVLSDSSGLGKGKSLGTTEINENCVGICENFHWILNRYQEDCL